MNERLDKYEEKMMKTLDNLEQEFAGIRAGRSRLNRKRSASLRNSVLDNSSPMVAKAVLQELANAFFRDSIP